MIPGPASLARSAREAPLTQRGGKMRTSVFTRPRKRGKTPTSPLNRQVFPPVVSSILPAMTTSRTGYPPGPSVIPDLSLASAQKAWNVDLAVHGSTTASL